MPGMDGLSHHMSGETPKKCDSYHPYSSNPLLCKGCNGPVYEHVTYMKFHEEKEAKKAKAKSESYDQKRARVLEYARTEIDPPVEKPEEETIDVGGIRMSVSYLEKLRDVMAEPKLTMKPEPPTRTTIQIPFPPPFDDGGEESVRYVSDDALARKMKKCFGG